jgi:predicted acylesterase/phospholipase RssA
MRRRGLVFAWLTVALAACHGPPRRCPPAALPLSQLVDVHADDDPTVPVIDLKLTESLAASMSRPGTPEPGRRVFNVLALSGGGSYGAYSAGVLVGWTENGDRPEFDVVTGVSTGAIVAVCAFLGPDFDPGLRWFYTTVTNRDVYTRKNELAGLLSESLADSKPLERLIAFVADETLLNRVAAEHAKGRRLYVGTTHLDSRRLVVWDMGAIASRGRPEDLELFRKVLLASASIPGFFPPVPLPVEVDGKTVEELHVDGGVTASIFFRPPRVSHEDVAKLGENPLAGSNLYIVVAGKLFADPRCVERRFIKIAGDSITALLYAQARGDLFQLFAICLATKMNYYLTAVPQDLPAPADATTFDPVEMTALFEAGRQAAKAGNLWRSIPPGLQEGELIPPRAGTQFVTTPPIQPADVIPASGTQPAESPR